MRDGRAIISRALRLLLRPVTRFCLRHSLRIQDVLEAVKSSLLDSAVEELTVHGTKATDSVLSVMTGLHRRDIVRLRSGGAPLDKAHNLVTKIIGQWQSDRRFLSANGKPRNLSFGTETSEFSKLVKLISNDITPASVLTELERTGLVAKSESDVKLVEKTYSPKGDPERGFNILSDDLGDLVQAVEENLLEDPEVPNMHLRTVYDRVDPKSLKEIRSWMIKQGQDLHLRARDYLSQYDLDINPQRAQAGNGARVVITSFGRVEER